MYKVNPASNRINAIQPKSFHELGFKERENLQEWVANLPSALGEELLIVQKEFAGFSDTMERLDLLALDKNGNLVVIENKLDDSGRDVTWQALKYASYCSTLTKENIRQIFQKFLGEGITAEDKLSEFFDGADYDDIELNLGTAQRIILIAAHFRKEVTSTVLWLLNFNIRIQCFKVAPFASGEDIFLNIEQIIPTKDSEDYMISIAEKAQTQTADHTASLVKKSLRKRFWNNLLQRLPDYPTNLFSNVTGSHASWIASSSGLRGVSYNFAIGYSFCRIELYIDRGKNSEQENIKIFEQLKVSKDEIEENLGNQLIWEAKDSVRYRRLRYEFSGNLQDESLWEDMISQMIELMVKLEKSVQSKINDLKSSAKDF